MSDVQTQIIEPLRAFYKDSRKLVEKCTKPDAKGAFTIFAAPPHRAPQDWRPRRRPRTCSAAC